MSKFASSLQDVHFVLKTGEGGTEIHIHMCSSLMAACYIDTPYHTELRGAVSFVPGTKIDRDEVRLACVQDALYKQRRPVPAEYAAEVELAVREYLEMPIPVEIGIPVVIPESVEVK